MHCYLQKAGPTPYLSSADSPYADQLGLQNFFLEDFEDGALNTPGIVAPAFTNHVRGPSSITDSVDADTGMIDGSGNEGHSLISDSFAVLPTGTGINVFMFELNFGKSGLLELPDSFGFVLTDSHSRTWVNVQLSRNGASIVSHEFPERFGDADFDGDTDEDVFLGVMADEAFDKVNITTFYFDVNDLKISPEIDHIQYGWRVPEPCFVIQMFLITMFFPRDRKFAII